MIEPRTDALPVKWVDLGMTESLPTGTVTLLLADVEGSTRLWETQPEEMTAAVAQLDRTVADVIARHGGVRPVEQGEGDSFVVAFASATKAVACALDLQLAPMSPIRLRIGVHTGEVQLRDGDNYMGPTVNRTARLRDLAHGGQTVLSGATEELLEDRLPDGAWLSDLGTRRLRDLHRPIRVAQLCHFDLRNDFPPLRIPDTVATQNLPVQLTSFIGRSTQIGEIRGAVMSNRLVTLTGAGGAGKTRLAIEVAGQITDQFPGGVWYADLAPITDPAVVPLAVARGFGLPDQPGRSTTDMLVRFVLDRHMLLVLDNCEHLLDASAALVVELLGACEGLTLLATSREPIGVGGEVSWQVPSLSLDDEAIELFSDRASRARPDFTMAEGNAATVAEICRRLDGMPLAIELAAARVRTLSLDEIVGGLHDRFRLLTGGARTAVRRQQTLRASVDWSHALLTEPERVLFRRLAVFMGGFDLAAAQAVGGNGEVQRYQVLDQLSLLVDKSIVVAENTNSPTRYHLLETVRQYAMEKLGDSGEGDDARIRHRDHYTAMAIQLDAPTRGLLERYVEQADREIDNLRAAFAWSLENNDLSEALELACSLQPLWLMRGRVLEAAAWLGAATVDAGGRGPDVVPALLRARALTDRAMLSQWMEIPGANDLAEEGLAIARELDDPALLARALTAYISVAVVHDPEVARPYFAEAIEAARRTGDTWRLCQILGRQTNAEFVAGDLIATESVARQGIEVADAVGDHFGSGQCRWALVGVHIHRGEVVIAINMARELIARAGSAHDPLSKSIGMYLQAFALAFHGETAAAHACASTALEDGAELAPTFAQSIYVAVAAACLADGDPGAAWEAALTAEHAGVNPATDNQNMIWMTQAALAFGDLGVASRWAEAAVSGSRRAWRAGALSARAYVRVAQGERVLAANDAYEALTIASETGAHLATADTLECLAGALFDSARSSEAVRLLGAAHAIRERLGLVRFKAFQDRDQASVAAMRSAMGDDEFDATWAEGAALSTDEAIAYAQRGRGVRKRPASGWASLTPTELDVVRLVQQGLSNKDIAIRLFVSPRTVQTHLTHVYTKLALASRVQLVQEAALHT